MSDLPPPPQPSSSLVESCNKRMAALSERVKFSMRMSRELRKQCMKLSYEKTWHDNTAQNLKNLLSVTKIQTDCGIHPYSFAAIREIETFIPLNKFALKGLHEFGTNLKHADIEKKFSPGAIDITFNNDVNVNIRLTPVIDKKVSSDKIIIIYEGIGLEINVEEKQFPSLFTENQVSVITEIIKDKILLADFQNPSEVTKITSKIREELSSIVKGGGELMEGER